MTSFDVREFARTAHGSHRADLDLDAISAAGIGIDAARLLRTLRDLERSTMQRMRNLLVTATHKDARVTAFLTTWAFEKFWVADALDAVLDATGHPAEADEGADGHRRRTIAERADRRGPIARAIAGNFAGPRLVAAHVTVGLIDEWITTAAFRRLGEIAAGLEDVVEMIVEVKERHIRFLHEEAVRRLAESDRARTLTVKEIRRTAWPVGANERSAQDRSFFEATVFGGAAGRVEALRIGDLVSALPGMDAVGSTVASRLLPRRLAS